MEFDIKDPKTFLTNSVMTQLNSASGNDIIVNKLVDQLTEVEINNRIEALKKVVKLIEDKTKELQKIKPDLKSFDKDGQIVTETFSEELNSKRRKLKDEFEKLNSAVEEAFVKFEWDKLKELTASK